MKPDMNYSVVVHYDKEKNPRVISKHNTLKEAVLARYLALQTYPKDHILYTPTKEKAIIECRERKTKCKDQYKRTNI